MRRSITLTALLSVSGPTSFMSFGKTLIFCLDKAFAIGAVEPANGKVPQSHSLEMFNEYIIHGGAAQRADDRQGLGSNLFRHHYSKARGHLRDEAHQHRGAFLDDTAMSEVARGFGHALGKQAAQGEISPFSRIVGCSPPAQGKELDARQRRCRMRKSIA